MSFFCPLKGTKSYLSLLQTLFYCFPGISQKQHREVHRETLFTTITKQILSSDIIRSSMHFIIETAASLYGTSVLCQAPTKCLPDIIANPQDGETETQRGSISCPTPKKLVKIRTLNQTLLVSFFTFIWL